MRSVASVVSLDGFRIDVEEPLLQRLSSNQQNLQDVNAPGPTRGPSDMDSVSSLRHYDLSKHALRHATDRLPTDRVRDKKRRIEWLELDCEGGENTIWADKRGVCAQKGLKPPVRDLRVLDPAFISPGSGYLLARDKCIIVALEHVRMIIMKDRVLIPMKHCENISARESSGDMGFLQQRPCSKSLHQELVQLIRRQTRLYATSGGTMEEGGSCLARSSTYSNLDLIDTFSERMSPMHLHPEERTSMGHSGTNGNKPSSAAPCDPLSGRGAKGGDNCKEDPETGAQPQIGTLDSESNIIPFEHAILDTALTAVTGRLRAATDKLDSHREIVDQLTCNVDRETLVSVRMLKNEQQELLDRVSVVLECLEHTAEEKTLAHLCLTHRDVLKALDQSMPSTGCPGWGDMTPQVGGFGSTQNIAQSMPHRRATSAAPSGVPTLSGGMAPTRRPSSGTVGGLTGSRSAQNCTSPSSQGDAAATLFREDGRTSFEQVSHHSQFFEVDEWEVQRRAVRGMFMSHVQRMEALVDSNFIEAHACQHKLQSLGKYITDVEAFVNIHMDAVRNRMIKFEIWLMVGTFALGVYAVIAGVLGENIPLAPRSLVDGEHGFVFINLSVSLMCFAIFVSIIVCARRNGLM